MIYKVINGTRNAGWSEPPNAILALEIVKEVLCLTIGLVWSLFIATKNKDILRYFINSTFQIILHPLKFVKRIGFSEFQLQFSVRFELSVRLKYKVKADFELNEIKFKKGKRVNLGRNHNGGVAPEYFNDYGFPEEIILSEELTESISLKINKL